MPVIPGGGLGGEGISGPRVDPFDNTSPLSQLEAALNPNRAMKQTAQKVGGYTKIAPSFLVEVARVREHGALKYANWDWLNGHPLTELLDAIERHKLAIQAGQMLDPESKCHHAAHIACNCMFIIEGFYGGWLQNDLETPPRALLTPEAMMQLINTALNGAANKAGG